MKKFIIFLFAANITFAQVYRFTYENSAKKTSDSKPTNYTLSLEIDDNVIKFFDNVHLKPNASTYKLASNSLQQIIHLKNSSINKLYSTDPSNGYYVIESEDKIQWKLENENKIADKIKLNKATTSFGGRNWIAWYNEEIPFQEGPYKFRGLPGIIVELQDEEGLILYKMVKIEKLSKSTDTSRFLETFYGTKPLHISDQKFFAHFKDFYNDPLRSQKELLQNGNDLVLEDNIGLRSPITQQQLQQQKLMIQKEMRDNFVQIESDKAIDFTK